MDHEINIIAEGIDNASGPLGKLTGAMDGLGGAASIAGIAGAAGIGAIAVGAGMAAKAVFDFSKDSKKAMKLFSAQTGIVGKDLLKMEKSARNVWKKGFGDNIGDVVKQMALVEKAFGETGEELEDSTGRAMAMADIFEIDVAEGVMIASSMMNSWDISSQEAFDTMTAGSQMGLDRMGDLQDTLHEYSGDFSRLGFSAKGTLAILNAGLEEGAYNTDVIADGFREMNIRLTEGGDQVAEAFDTIGLNFQEIQDSVASGDSVWADHTKAIGDSLGAIENLTERNAAGVAIFGTKWEDVGGDIFVAAAQAQGGIEGVAGATDRAAETMADGWGPALERLKRSTIESLSPLGDKAAELLEKATPHIEKFADWLGVQIPLAMDAMGDFWEDNLKDSFEDIVAFIQDPIIPALKVLAEWWGKFIVFEMKVLAEVWNTVLKPIFSEIVAFIQDPIIPALEKMAEWLGPRMAAVFETWEGWWNDILKPVLEAIVGFIDGHLLPAIGKIANAWSTAFGGALNLVRPIFNELIGLLEGGLNAGIGGINNLVDGANRVPGVNISKIDDIQLPRLAKGGMVQAAEQMAVLHGPEVVLPLDNPGTISALSKALGEAGGNGAGGTVVHMNFGADSVRSDEDIMSIADAIDDALALRGLQPAL